jgi:hypothetical protein
MDNIKEYILSNKENSRELLNIIFKSIKPIEIRRNLIDYGIKMKDFKLISMAQKIEYLECNKYMCKPLQFSDIKLIKINDINYTYELIDIIFAQNEEITIDIDIDITHQIYKKIVNNIIRYNLSIKNKYYHIEFYEKQNLDIVKYIIYKPFIADDIVLVNYLLEIILSNSKYKIYFDTIMNHNSKVELSEFGGRDVYTFTSYPSWSNNKITVFESLLYLCKNVYPILRDILITMKYDCMNYEKLAECAFKNNDSIIINHIIKTCINEWNKLPLNEKEYKNKIGFLHKEINIWKLFITSIKNKNAMIKELICYTNKYKTPVSYYNLHKHTKIHYIQYMINIGFMVSHSKYHKRCFAL